MKQTVLSGALCLAIGIAIGWIAKPRSSDSAAVGNDPTGTSAAKASPAAKPTPPTQVSGSSGLASKSIRPAESADNAKDPAVKVFSPGPAMQERFQKMMLDQATQKSARKVAELAEKLGLTEEQTARLQAHFDAKLAEITSRPDASGGMPDMMALAKLHKTSSIDAALADILSADQSAAYEDLKTKERNRKVESRAYKDLARINSVLDLNDDQKNAVYDIVYEDAGRKLDQAGDSGSAMAMIMDGHGIDVDVDDIGISGIVQTAIDSEGNPSPMSPEDMMKSMREGRQRKIDEEVNRLAPALTPEQAAQYRKHLETKNSDMYHNMIIDGEDGADGPSSIFIESSISE